MKLDAARVNMKWQLSYIVDSRIEKSWMPNKRIYISQRAVKARLRDWVKKCG